MTALTVLTSLAGSTGAAGRVATGSTGPAPAEPPTTTGLVTFRLGDREYATPLTAVREVVRLQGLAALPGMTRPLAGVVDLRGTALPVLDLRVGAEPGDRGDVLVLERPAGKPAPTDPTDATAPTGPAGATAPTGPLLPDVVGVAVDQVRAVLAETDLAPAGGAADQGVLPAYVRRVLRGPDGVVFLVDLEQMVAAAAG